LTFVVLHLLVGSGSIVMGVSVGLYESISQKLSPRSLCVFTVAAVRSSSGSVEKSCVLPVLWMTLCVPIIGPMAA